MTRRLASLINVPYFQVGRLDMPTEPVVVEQRTRGAILRELAPDRLQQGRFGGELERQRLVFMQTIRDKLRQPCRVEQARADPAGERIALASQYRQAGPQRVGGRRMRIVGQCIEIEVCSALASQMIRQRI